MGLDWNPMARPKPGHEAELARIIATDFSSLPDAEATALRERFAEISEPPYATLGAPRVGHDAIADAWLADTLRENGRIAALDQTKADMRGHYVLQLLPASPGLPVYGSVGYDGVDRYTFRAAFLDLAVDVIGDVLHERAWETMTAEELREYGEALLAAGRRYASIHGVSHLENQRELDPFDGQSPEAKAHVVFSAAAWCGFWAERAHGLEPYF